MTAQLDVPTQHPVQSCLVERVWHQIGNYHLNEKKTGFQQKHAHARILLFWAARRCNGNFLSFRNRVARVLMSVQMLPCSEQAQAQRAENKNASHYLQRYISTQAGLRTTVVSQNLWTTSMSTADSQLLRATDDSFRRIIFGPIPASASPRKLFPSASSTKLVPAPRSGVDHPTRCHACFLKRPHTLSKHMHANPPSERHAA